MARRRKRRPAKSRQRIDGVSPPPETAAWTAPGARVARVAVDDQTWAEFRALCGPTPASIRLGDLVRTEVARAGRRREPTIEALQALRVITDQAHALESYVRRLPRSA